MTPVSFLKRSRLLWAASVREQLPVPKSKRGAQRAPEAAPEAVDDCAPLRVHQREHARLVVQQHAHAVRLAHQRHRHQLANTQEAALVPTQSSRGMPASATPTRNSRDRFTWRPAVICSLPSTTAQLRKRSGSSCTWLGSRPSMRVMGMMVLSRCASIVLG
ncbi:hypothetical protein CRUP_024903 [Coryphaenoides rupestris]|nr:hypothetical protein CRUP_024903 [Coryphaenoides rupestris]